MLGFSLYIMIWQAPQHLFCFLWTTRIQEPPGCWSMRLARTAADPFFLAGVVLYLTMTYRYINIYSCIYNTKIRNYEQVSIVQMRNEMPTRRNPFHGSKTIYLYFQVNFKDSPGQRYIQNNFRIQTIYIQGFPHPSVWTLKIYNLKGVQEYHDCLGVLRKPKQFPYILDVCWESPLPFDWQFQILVAIQIADNLFQIGLGPICKLTFTQKLPSRHWCILKL